MVSFLNHVFLDEPTANLDLNSSIITGKSIVSKRSAQRIIVMATRNLYQARRMAQMKYFIYNGEMVEARKAREFLRIMKTV